MQAENAFLKLFIISSVATSAFLSASSGTDEQAITMQHLLEASEAEYRKIGRLLPQSLRNHQNALVGHV